MFKTAFSNSGVLKGYCALALGVAFPYLVEAADPSDASERLAAAPAHNSISSQPAGVVKPDASTETSEIESPPGLGCQVDSLVFASKVEDKMPDGIANSFPPGLLFCWSRVHCTSSPGTLTHVWTQAKTRREISMRMSSSSGRVWSQKQVTPGTWKVEVMTSDGSLAGSGTVEVK